MEKINFVNNSTPYLSAENLNQMQSNVENAINGVVLYENADGSNETITLNDNATNYSFIEIFYKERYNNILNSIRIIPENECYVHLLNNYPFYGDGVGNVTTFYLTRYKLINNKIELTDSYSRITLRSYNNTIEHAKTNDNYITKVIGYK